MAKNKNIAKVSNSFLESLIQNNNATTLKTIFYISKSDLVTTGEDLMTFRIDIKDMCEYCNLDAKTLRRNLKKMVETSVNIKHADGEAYISLIPFVDIKHNGSLEVKMFKEVLNELIAVKNKFTIIDVSNIMKLSSKHSLKMIQLVERINNYSDNVAKRKTMTLKELNAFFGVKYSRVGQIVSNVLEPAKREIDQYSKLSFIYEVEYDKTDITVRGRAKAVGVVIDVVRNTPQPQLF